MQIHVNDMQCGHFLRGQGCCWRLPGQPDGGRLMTEAWEGEQTAVEAFVSELAATDRCFTYGIDWQASWAVIWRCDGSNAVGSREKVAFVRRSSGRVFAANQGRPDRLLAVLEHSIGEETVDGEQC